MRVPMTPILSGDVSGNCQVTLWNLWKPASILAEICVIYGKPGIHKLSNSHLLGFPDR
jgi:hypothetical protein